MIRRAAVLVAAALLLSACGAISPGTAMSRWVTQSNFRTNATSLFRDVQSSAKDLRNESLTGKDLHSLCSVLFVDDGSMQASLPTPDSQATALLDRAYRDFATAAVECYSAVAVPSDRVKALAALSRGAAVYSEARARVSAAQS